jgi:nitrate/nitrite transporter NarK
VPAGRKGSIALIVLCQSTQALAFGAIALFLPLIREDVDMTFSEAGTLSVASTLTYAAMQIPSGYLADRFGARKLFVLGLLGTNAMSFLFAVLHSYELLLINQAVSGFFRSLVFAPGLLLISSHFAADRRATAMGLYVAGGFSSNVVLSLVGPLLVGPLGWRMLFMMSSAIAVAIVLLYWRVGAHSPPAPNKSPVRIGDLATLLRHRVIWVAGVIQFVRLALVQAIRFWLPTFLVVDRGFSLQLAGVVVAVGAAVTAPANIVGGYVSDRLQRPLLVIGTSLAALGASCILLVTVDGVAMILLVVAVQSVFIQVYFGPLFEVPIRLLGSESAGSINGFSNFCANVGGLTFAYAFGAVKDTTGSFEVGFFALAGMCAVALSATWMLSRMAPRSETGPTVPGPHRGAPADPAGDR